MGTAVRPVSAYLIWKNEKIFLLPQKHGISLGSEATTNGETGSNMTNGPERIESAQDTPTMSADSILGEAMLFQTIASAILINKN